MTIPDQHSIADHRRALANRVVTPPGGGVRRAAPGGASAQASASWSARSSGVRSRPDVAASTAQPADVVYRTIAYWTY